MSDDRLRLGGVAAMIVGVGVVWLVQRVLAPS
jgi:uncharacterized protein YjeT (DUF2065 family)